MFYSQLPQNSVSQYKSQSVVTSLLTASNLKQTQFQNLRGFLMNWILQKLEQNLTAHSYQLLYKSFKTHSCLFTFTQQNLSCHTNHLNNVFERKEIIMDINFSYGVLYRCLRFTFRESMHQMLGLSAVSDRCPIVSCVKLVTWTVQDNLEQYKLLRVQNVDPKRLICLWIASLKLLFKRYSVYVPSHSLLTYRQTRMAHKPEEKKDNTARRS